MRNKAWKGRLPKSDSDARERLHRAAQHCLKQHGPKALNVSNIAREAGVTRQTFYRYFDNVEALLISAVASASGGITFRLHEHARKFDTPAERAVESMLFMYREIPNDPLLSGLFLGDSPPKQAVDRIFSPASVQRAIKDFAQVLGIADNNTSPSENLYQATELMLRLLWSLLSIPSPRMADEKALKAFLRKWVGIPVGVLFGEK
jgi:AcrR family transcriptional regulator